MAGSLLLGRARRHTMDMPGIDPGLPPPAGAPHLHRFQAGDRWTYDLHTKNGTGRAEISVLPDRVKGPDGKECLVFRLESTDEKGVTTVAEGAFRQDKEGSELLYGTRPAEASAFRWGLGPRPYSLVVRSPIYTGEKWVGAIQFAGGDSQSLTASADRDELVATPAGKFKAVHLREGVVRMKGNTMQGASFNEVWLSPQIGFPVKQQNKGPQGMETQELVSYHLAGG